MPERQPDRVPVRCLLRHQAGASRRREPLALQRRQLGRLVRVGRPVRSAVRAGHASTATTGPDNLRLRLSLRARDKRQALEHWRERRTLASWDWVDLGSLTGAKRLEQVWLALRRAQLELADAPRATGAPFAVQLTLRPPAGMAATLATLVKPLFDGTICALQAHTDRSTVADLASRLSRTLHAPPEEIQALLMDDTRAVLGSARRLLHARGAGVAWAPADDQCHAGEILAAHPGGSTWQIAGKVTELIPA